MKLMKLKGIDVSHHQGKIDWQTVKNSGIDFAIVRVGYSNRNGKGGLNFDKRYDYNISQCNKLGIPVGVYIYCYDTTPEAATITTKALMKVVKRYRLEYPVIYDIEYDNEKLPKAVNTAIVNAAMKVIEAENYYGMVYASKDFFINHLNMADLKGTDKWEAAYSRVDTGVVNNSMWQYSSKGTIPGITGSVDLDYSYKDYPSIIRKAGLNGLSTTEAPKPANTVNSNSVPKSEPKVEPPKTNFKTVTAGKLNVRSGPGMNFESVKILTKGTTVNVIEVKGEWARINTDQWVNTKFIK